MGARTSRWESASSRGYWQPRCARSGPAAATRGRSALLASGEEALEEHPIATLTNLRRVLRRVGEVMNDDEDVLFLFVSGHGSRDHQLSAWQPGLDAEPANPTALARVLQDS